MGADTIRKRSVLLICHTYPPVVGGSEVEAQRVASALIARGHAVEVLCAGGPPMPAVNEWIDPAGVPVRILTRRSQGRMKDLWFALRVAWILWNERRRYEIAYFLMQGLHLAAGLPLTHWLKKAAVMKVGGSGVIPLMRASRMGRWELDWLQRWRIKVLVLNDGMVEEALADGFVREQLMWMPNPVDTQQFRPPAAGEAEAWRQRHGIPLDAPVAIYVGRLSAEKGLIELLRGFAAAAREIPRGLLVLVGDGAQRRDLESLAKELGIADQVRFVGRVPIEQVPAWLRASDVFTLISPSEGFSCALLEAMSVGLPSVVSDIPANRQLVDDGQHGFSIPFGDAEAAGRAFGTALRDAELRRRLGAAARQRVIDNYSTERIARLYESLFDEIAG